MTQQSYDTQRISRIRVGVQAVRPMSVVNDVTKSEFRRATPPKLEIGRASIALSLFCTCFILQGCSSVKKTLGIDRDPPNEYVVTPSAQPLEMPPDFSCLPIPMPGVERPQDRVARQTQEEKFLGSTRDKKSLSPGQKALLMKSGAQPNQDEIRYTIDKEVRMEENTDKTVVERLGIKKPKPPGDAVNPYEESLELQKQGIPMCALPPQEVSSPSAKGHIQPSVETSPLPSGFFE